MTLVLPEMQSAQVGLSKISDTMRPTSFASSTLPPLQVAKALVHADAYRGVDQKLPSPVKRASVAFWIGSPHTAHLVIGFPSNVIGPALPRGNGHRGVA